MEGVNMSQNPRAHTHEKKDPLVGFERRPEVYLLTRLFGFSVGIFWYFKGCNVYTEKELLLVILCHSFIQDFS